MKNVILTAHPVEFSSKRETYLAEQIRSGPGSADDFQSSLGAYRNEVENSWSCTVAAVVEGARTATSSAAVWYMSLLHFGWRTPPPFLPKEFVVHLFVATLALYVYELSRRRTLWAVACPCGGGREGFAKYIADLHDAAPVVDLCPVGSPPEPYRIAEWRDETQEVWAEEVPSGLFLVTFPVEIVPGNASEASSLESARARCLAAAKSAITDEERSPLTHGDMGHGSSVAVRARLRFTNGQETGEPAPVVLATADELWLVRPVLFLAIPLLLGIVADLLLRLFLQPLPWPVRKRLYSIEGSADLGVIKFFVRCDGLVVMEGDEEAVKSANSFWLTASEWDVIWSELKVMGVSVARMRKILLVSCMCAGVVGTVTAIAVFVLPERMALWGLCLLLALLLFSALVACHAYRKASVFTRRLEEKLHGGAWCSVSWEFDGDDMMLVTVEQRVTASTAKTIFSSQAAPPSKSSTMR